MAPGQPGRGNGRSETAAAETGAAETGARPDPAVRPGLKDQLRILHQSGMVDGGWYRDSYPDVVDGYFVPGDKPGLGVDINEDKVRDLARR